MRLRCYSCGKSVSTEVPDDTVLRAVATCPECVGKTASVVNLPLLAVAPELLEALKIVCVCGEPERASLYDEEGVEGWKWTHPDGREWCEIGDWDEPPPLHPVAAEAIAKAEGREQ